MDRHQIPLPGDGPIDPPNDIDPIAGHLERIKTNLVWIDQYRLNIEHCLHADPNNVARELTFLKDATDVAIRHLRRLTELLLAGYRIMPDKAIPPNLHLPPKTH
jgi:hypothetical protein